MKNFVLLACCIALILPGCRKNPERAANNAFYYWRSTLELTEADITRMQELRIRALYVKFFDVDWDGERNMAIPLGVTQFNTAIPSGIELIPTIFITNSSLKNLHVDEIEPLAKKMLAKIHRMLQTLPERSIPVIQFDCDWATATREKYFAFLQAAHSQLWDKDIVLSATIRLHQIKYSGQTGVPPISKGLLMCYNMGSPTRIDTKNSILDIEQVKQYIQSLESYPLPLDVALPLFSWGVLFCHQDFVKLINHVRAHNLLDHQDFERDCDNVFRRHIPHLRFSFLRIPI